MAQVIQTMQIIIEEMGRGNFSFLILVVGIAQLIVMVRNGRRGSSGSGGRRGNRGSRSNSMESDNDGASNNKTQ